MNNNYMNNTYENDRQQVGWEAPDMPPFENANLPFGGENKPHKNSYFVVRIIALVLIFLDLLGYLWVGYNYLSNHTTILSKFDVYGNNWVEYDKDGAHIWKFNKDNRCDVYLAKSGKDAVLISDDLPFSLGGNYVSVTTDKGDIKEFFFDSDLSCMWEYKNSKENLVRIKLLAFKDFPTKEQNARNIKGYKYLRYGADYKPDAPAAAVKTAEPETVAPSEVQYPTFTRDEFYNTVQNAYDDFLWLYYRLESEGRINKNDYYTPNPEYEYDKMYASDLKNASELKEYLSDRYSSEFIDEYFLGDGTHRHGNWIARNGKLYFADNWGVGVGCYDKERMVIEDNDNGRYTVKVVDTYAEVNDEEYDKMIAEGKTEIYTLETRNGRLIVTGYEYNEATSW